jgi:Zn-finger protein
MGLKIVSDKEYTKVKDTHGNSVQETTYYPPRNSVQETTYCPPPLYVSAVFDGECWITTASHLQYSLDAALVKQNNDAEEAALLHKIRLEIYASRNWFCRLFMKEPK